MTTSNQQQQPWALEGLRVLDLTGYLSQNCARVLGDLGADVIKIEPPGGDPARYLPPFAGDVRDPERSLRFIHANRSKRSVVLDITDPADREKARTLAERSDILVEDFTPGYLAGLGLGYDDLKRANPGLVYVSITPFGQTGPYASYRGGDLVAQAVGGIMFANGDDTAPPVGGPYEIVSQLACVHAAFGALLAVRARRASANGHGQHVDVSRQEVVLWSENTYISRYSYQDLITRREGHHSAFGAVNTYRTAGDGYVNVSIYMGAHFLRMTRNVMDHPVMSDDMWADRTVRQENREVIDAFVQEYTETQDRDELVERAQKLGVPIVPVLSPAEFVEHAHTKARGYFFEMEHPVIGTYKTAGPPFQLRGSPWRPTRPAPLLGQHTEEVLRELEQGMAKGARPHGTPGENGRGPQGKPLNGVRVADFTRVFAGPIATMYLAFFGAEVIKVESADLDDSRSPGQSTFPDLNRGKLSCTIDTRTAEGKHLVHDLAKVSDLVMENFRPGVMNRLGIGYESLKKARPDLVMIAMPGMGETGPMADYFCYGQQIMGMSGLTYLWGHPGAPLDVRIKMPFADYVAGIFGALASVAALEFRDRTGQGQYIEMAQLEGTAHLLSVPYLDYTVNGRAPEAIGNRSVLRAPHNVYRCLGHDAWVAIEVGTEDEWRALVRALGNPRWAQDEKFATHEGRVANADELDGSIAEWTRQFTPRQAMRILQRAGVPAGMVSTGEDLHGDPHLRARPAAIVEALHPDAGWIEHQGINVNLSRTPGDAGVPAPAKGQHNDYVFQKVLGLSDARHRELDAAGALR